MNTGLVYIFGLFLVLHGLVHLLYYGQSVRWFELQAGLVWPDGAWAFSKLVGDKATRWLAGAACLLAAIGFMTGGVALFAGWLWWRPVIVASAAFSAMLFGLFWDLNLQRLDDKGGVGLLINLGILAISL